MHKRHNFKDMLAILLAGIVYFTGFGMVSHMHHDFAVHFTKTTGWIAEITNIIIIFYALMPFNNDKISKLLKKISLKAVRFMSIFTISLLIICYFIYEVFNIETLNVSASSFNFDVATFATGITLLLWLNYDGKKRKSRKK